VLWLPLLCRNHTGGYGDHTHKHHKKHGNYKHSNKHSEGQRHYR
jgi:hypothetical protein